MKDMKRGGKGMGITTDHNGNLIQINRKGVRFIGMSQPDTVVKMMKMETAQKKLAQAARMRLGDEGQQNIIDKYVEMMRGEKGGPNSAHSTSSNMNIQKIASEDSINAGNFSAFGNKDLRGSLIQG